MQENVRRAAKPPSLWGEKARRSRDVWGEDSRAFAFNLAMRHMEARFFQGFC